MSTEDLLAQAEQRLTVSRLGKSHYHETDQDLVVIQRLVEEVRRLQNPPLVAVEAPLGLEDRKFKANEKLAEVVNELTALRDEEHPEDLGEEPEIATCWVLCVGYEDMSGGGSVTIFPKDERQAGWKTSGILGECLNGMEGER
ncbi:hypothetical protein SEA_SIENNA_93 [Gordonia phage Sienna]|uniref:Uncharacterized protein n=1 Tax=Gordonia phage Sienna TaxID=2759396 RepID=A0A7L7SM35_9CAUD|nr:hypothetical protein SEA_SIENNA_93 [Gordonia phage Sienna]